MISGGNIAIDSNRQGIWQWVVWVLVGLGAKGCATTGSATGSAELSDRETPPLDVVTVSKVKENHQTCVDVLQRCEKTGSPFPDYLPPLSGNACDFFFKSCDQYHSDLKFKWLKEWPSLVGGRRISREEMGVSCNNYTYSNNIKADEDVTCLDGISEHHLKLYYELVGVANSVETAYILTRKWGRSK